MQFIRGDPLFLGNAVDNHSRHPACPKREEKPAQHCGRWAAEAVKKRRKKEKRNQAPAEILKNFPTLAGDVVANLVAQSSETDRLKIDSGVAHMSGFAEPDLVEKG